MQSNEYYHFGKQMIIKIIHLTTDINRAEITIKHKHTTTKLLGSVQQ